MTGYVTIAFLLTALHTAPLPREFLGFTPERNNFFGMLAPDRDWLGFVQYVSEKSMPSSEEGRIFDGSRFRLPYHENDVWPTFIFRYASRRENFGSVAVRRSGSGLGERRYPRRTPRDPPASDVHWRTVWASGRGRGAACSLSPSRNVLS